MPVLDFKEIPKAHEGSGLQDTFELFARDFLDFFGYEVVESPSRGADGGKDLIVIEKRIGIGGITIIRWLVSCKHKAHSGTSVSVDDELNIRDRLETHTCTGFVGFYSTLPSSGLVDKLNSLKSSEVQIFDREKIESFLLNNRDGLILLYRYFPISTKKWLENRPVSYELTLRESFCADYLKRKRNVKD